VLPGRPVYTMLNLVGYLDQRSTTPLAEMQTEYVHPPQEEEQTGMKEKDEPETLVHEDLLCSSGETSETGDDP
jgi:hypothetical protein